MCRWFNALGFGSLTVGNLNQDQRRSVLCKDYASDDTAGRHDNADVGGSARNGCRKKQRSGARQRRFEPLRCFQPSAWCAENFAESFRQHPRHCEHYRQPNNFPRQRWADDWERQHRGHPHGVPGQRGSYTRHSDFLQHRHYHISRCCRAHPGHGLRNWLAYNVPRREWPDDEHRSKHWSVHHVPRFRRPDNGHNFD